MTYSHQEPMRSPHKKPAIGVAVLLLAAAIGGLSLAQARQFSSIPTLNGEAGVGEGGADEELKTIREGTQLIDYIGVFMISGDRTIFETVDGKQRFVVLENLNLERVMRMVQDGAGELVWIVDGLVTEYRGDNFLLVKRAVRKMAPVEPRARGPISANPGESGGL